MRSIRISLLFALLAVACASGQRPAGVTQADVSVRPKGVLFFGSGRTAPLNLDVSVTNRASVPIKVRWVRLTSPSMLQYAIRPIEQPVQETLAPGQTKTVTIAATAIASESALSPSEPLSLRAEVAFEAQGQQFRELFNFPNVVL